MRDLTSLNRPVVPEQAEVYVKVPAVLVEELKELLRERPIDPEDAHSKADRLLLEAIGDQELMDLWEACDFWYA